MPYIPCAPHIAHIRHVRQKRHIHHVRDIPSISHIPYVPRMPHILHIQHISHVPQNASPFPYWAYFCSSPDDCMPSAVLTGQKQGSLWFPLALCPSKSLASSLPVPCLLRGESPRCTCHFFSRAEPTCSVAQMVVCLVLYCFDQCANEDETDPVWEICLTGVALGFASRELFSNFFGGLVLFFTQPFVVGNAIKVRGRGCKQFKYFVKGW